MRLFQLISAVVLTSPLGADEIPFRDVSAMSFPGDGSSHDSDVVVKKLDL